jgi:hypothetical protein
MRGKAPLPADLPISDALLWKLQQNDHLAAAPTRRVARDERCEGAEFAPVGDRAALSDQPSSSYWTRRLLSAGFTVDECMAIRGLPRETVLEHARQIE